MKSEPNQPTSMFLGVQVHNRSTPETGKYLTGTIQHSGDLPQVGGHLKLPNIEKPLPVIGMVGGSPKELVPRGVSRKLRRMNRGRSWEVAHLGA